MTAAGAGQGRPDAPAVTRVRRWPPSRRDEKWNLATQTEQRVRARELATARGATEVAPTVRRASRAPQGLAAPAAVVQPAGRRSRAGRPVVRARYAAVRRRGREARAGHVMAGRPVAPAGRAALKAHPPVARRAVLQVARCGRAVVRTVLLGGRVAASSLPGARVRIASSRRATGSRSRPRSLRMSWRAISIAQHARGCGR